MTSSTAALCRSGGYPYLARSLRTSTRIFARTLSFRVQSIEADLRIDSVNSCASKRSCSCFIRALAEPFSASASWPLTKQATSARTTSRALCTMYWLTAMKTLFSMSARSSRRRRSVRLAPLGHTHAVMPGLVPGIHAVALRRDLETESLAPARMAGTSPAMTERGALMPLPPPLALDAPLAIPAAPLRSSTASSRRPAVAALEGWA